jgi:hypothetical protein
MNDNFNMRAAVARLSTDNVKLYLRAQGWEQKESNHEDRFYFEGEVDEAGDPCQLHLPALPGVPQYWTLLQRAIYLLSGVEDRQPSEIISDILAHEKNVPRAEVRQPKRRLRVRNSADTPLQLQIASRDAELCLFPGESIELVCESSGTLDFEYTEAGLTIRDQDEDVS